MKKLLLLIIGVALFLPQFHFTTSTELHFAHGQGMTHEEADNTCHDNNCIQVNLLHKFSYTIFNNELFSRIVLAIILLAVVTAIILPLRKYQTAFILPTCLRVARSTVFIE